MIRPQPWSEEETAIIKAGASMTMAELVEALPGRTKKSIQNRLYDLKIYARSSRKLCRWTDEEIAYLKAMHDKEPLHKIAKNTGHKYTSAMRMAAKLGLTVIRDRQKHCHLRRPWTKEDLATLRMHSKDRTLAELAAMLGRTKQAVSCKACDLGLTLIYGHKSLRDVAKILGVQHRTVAAHRDRLGQRWGKIIKETSSRTCGASFDEIQAIAKSIIDSGHGNLRASAKTLFKIINQDPLIGQVELDQCSD